MAKPYRKLPNLTQQDIDRFWNNISKTPGQGPSGNCWEWQNGTDKDGYGLFCARGKANLKVHRLAYLLQCGNDPVGFLVCHSCDNRRCCNGEHLFIGTDKDNMDDKIKKGRGRSWIYPDRPDHPISCIICGNPCEWRANRAANHCSRACYDLDISTNHCRRCGVRVKYGRKYCSENCRSIPVEDRFWANVDKLGINECWIWIGINRRGHGAFQNPANNEQIAADRFSWQMANGEIPSGMLIGHKCQHLLCVNPLHLFLQTRAEAMSTRFKKK